MARPRRVDWWSTWGERPSKEILALSPKWLQDITAWQNGPGEGGGLGVGKMSPSREYPKSAGTIYRHTP